MPSGSSRGVLAIGGLVAAALAVSAAGSDAARPDGLVILYGDSLSAEASTYFTEELGRISSAQVFTKPVPGAAPCDALESMRADVAMAPDVVVIQYAGNNGTDCVRGEDGERLAGQALADRYEADVRAAVELFAEARTRVVLVGGPPAPGLPGGAEAAIAEAYRRSTASAASP